MQSIFSSKGIKITLIILLVLLLLLSLYTSILRIKATRQHLKNERAVAEKLAKGELQITAKPTTDEEQ